MDDTDRITDAVHVRRQRAALLRAVGRRQDVPFPGAGSSPVLDDAVCAFGGERELLLAVHHQWQLNLLARLDQVLEVGAGDLHADVLRAVEEQSRALPGFAAMLREHADDRVLDAARRRLSRYVDQACPCGRRHPLVAPAVRRRSTTRCAVRTAAARWGRRLAQARMCGGHPTFRHAPGFLAG